MPSNKGTRSDTRSGSQQPVAEANAGFDAGPEAAAESVPIEQMIAEAAYFIAQQRNFQDGDPLADWLQAESEIARRIDSMRY